MKMTTKMIAEEWSTKPAGPTGRYREALVVDVVDYGGNVLGTARTPRGLERVQRSYRIPTRLVVRSAGCVVPDPDPRDIIGAIVETGDASS